MKPASIIGQVIPPEEPVLPVKAEVEANYRSSLAGFNVGVEGGQLIAVGGWVLLSQPLVGRSWYPGVVVRGASALLVLLAGWWFWQRVS